MSGDGFREAQDLTRAVRDGLKDVRGDVDAIVRREVEKTGIDEASMRKLVRQAVADELNARAAWALRWVVPGVALSIGLALGLSLFAIWSVRGGAVTAGPPATVAANDPPAAAERPQTAPPPTPAVLAARYDSLLAAHAATLSPLVEGLESETSNANVLAAANAWRLGMSTPDQRARLHTALVQAVLRAEVDATLLIDGNILRDPCGGRSCTALLRLWRDRAEEFGLPPWTATSAADGATLAVVERVLVLDRVERDG
jgi:hypothetical protein